MDKTAILVSAANAPAVLARTIDGLDDPRFRIFVHLAGATDRTAYTGAIPNFHRLTAVKARIAVFTGGFSVVEAELLLIRAALADPLVNRLVSWPDDTMALRPADEIHRALVEAPDQIGCEVRPEVQDWYRKFYLGDSLFAGFQDDPAARGFEVADWEDVQRLRQFVERGKKPLDAVNFSRRGWVLSRASATAILRQADQDEHLVESFRYSLFPELTFFATLFRLCFPEATVPDAPICADYRRLPEPVQYSSVEELPELARLPRQQLFIRRIAPSAKAVLDRIVWETLDLAGRGEAAAAEAAAIKDQEDYERALAAAIDCREDGEPEESVTLFKAILDTHPGDLRVSFELVFALKTLRRIEEADQVLSTALELYPDDAKLRHVWADLPHQILDHDETIRRAEIYRALFPPAQFPGAWHSLGMQFGSFAEMLRWDDTRNSIIALLDQAMHDPKPLRMCLWQATELGLVDQQRALVDAAEPGAWAELPPEAKINARLRVEFSELNHKLLAEVGARVISIGQNCLPYLLGGRWGLIAERERSEAMTPFDRGAFQKSNAALVIDADFSTFDEPGAFSETTSWDGQRMYRHDDTGVYFYHERGATWFKNDGAFFAHVDRMVSKWRQISRQGRRLFVFCLCGEGDLPNLLEVMDRRLLDREAHLLIVDVLPERHDCPAHERVTYLHIPYPKNYAWDNFAHQSEARGIGFELSVVLSIMDHMLGLLPEEAAAVFVAERRRLLRLAAAASAAWRGEHDNTVVLYAALHRLGQNDAEDTVAYARALRDNGRLEDARELLAQAVEHDPANYELQAAVAEAGVAPFDWAARLAELQILLQKFPPEVEPRSWATLAEELRVLEDHGLWDEAVALIEQRWRDFCSRADLFDVALETLILLGQRALTRRLLDEAAPAIRDSLPRAIRECVLQRLESAEANHALLRRSAAHVIPLGQNVMPEVLMARWGLIGGPRVFQASTPFELGDFFQDTAADAVADDFAALSVHASYVETPAWGGGVTLRHVPSGVTFMQHRTAKIGPMEAQRFFSHLDGMIAHWRQIKDAGQRIFLFFYHDVTDIQRLVAEVKGKLLGVNGRLVIVDLHEEPTMVADDRQVTFLHAPPPANYQWMYAFASASPEGLDYEARVLAPVIDSLRKIVEETAAARSRGDAERQDAQMA